jgi:hypothetical protein
VNAPADHGNISSTWSPRAMAIPLEIYDGHRPTAKWKNLRIFRICEAFALR